ncbi:MULTISPECIES: AfsR/SARP family transcriptional regulator [Streptomyces]|uniref:AfsR/SARP family transcriptional regulator n=1 Tax=Streptomyces flaveolus TaxID=67297 RepID=A0ABV3AMC1_9ACTN|nr:MULTISPECIES: AfsR/SARP family transcriptional regulator [Streptomyces]KOG62353.1 activator protein [Streptomyces antibioticus]KOV74730.1 activator protein [Streptomyces sp. NRRL WC-3723]MBG7697286.1 AfsR/SARP family transcriptional regulator [Streptomyces sp. MC1]
MRYELLGPLRVSDGVENFSLSAPKTEMTLATLLIGAGRVTTKEHLVTELWGARPPKRASAAVHVYLSQVRKFLVSAGDRSGRAISTKPSGYVLHLDDAGYDVADFQELIRGGRAHQDAGRHEAALEAFELALLLIRGPVLDGVAEGPALSSFATWVEAERLDCLELSVESRTALGRHREVISLLDGLITQYPLRESFYRQLMLVLYRAERQAEALRVYRRAQQVLRAELGLEPCRSLRRLHQAILTSDRLLDLPLAG